MSPDLQEEIHYQYYKPCENHMVGKVISPSGEATTTVLQNGHYVPSNCHLNNCVYTQISAPIIFGQRSSFLLWEVLSAETYNWSNCNYVLKIYFWQCI